MIEKAALLGWKMSPLHRMWEQELNEYRILILHLIAESWKHNNLSIDQGQIPGHGNKFKDLQIVQDIKKRLKHLRRNVPAVRQPGPRLQSIRTSLMISTLSRVEESLFLRENKLRIGSEAVSLFGIALEQQQANWPNLKKSDSSQQEPEIQVSTRSMANQSQHHRHSGRLLVKRGQ